MGLDVGAKLFRSSSAAAFLAQESPQKVAGRWGVGFKHPYLFSAIYMGSHLEDGLPGIGYVVRMGSPFISHFHGHLEGVPQPDP